MEGTSPVIDRWFLQITVLADQDGTTEENATTGEPAISAERREDY